MVYKEKIPKKDLVVHQCDKCTGSDIFISRSLICPDFARVMCNTCNNSGQLKSSFIAAIKAWNKENAESDKKFNIIRYTNTFYAVSNQKIQKL